MNTRIPELVAALVLEGHIEEAAKVMLVSQSKEAMDPSDNVFRSLDSLVKKNHGMWKSEKQGKFLLDTVSEKRFQDKAATAWAKRQHIPFTRAAYYQTSMEGFGKRDITKIRMRGMVYLFDDGGVVLRGKVKINHPKGGQGSFDPDWSHVEVNFRRPADMTPSILVGDPEILLKQQIKKNKPTLNLIKKIPHWEEKDILNSFVNQLSRGLTLSPAQMNLVKKMTPDGFSLADKEQWQDYFDSLIDGIVEKILPAKKNIFEDYRDSSGEDMTKQLHAVENAAREYKQRGYTTEWVGSSILYELEELVDYRKAAASIYGDASHYVFQQHQKAMKAKSPSKKALKIETLIQKAADKLKSMSKQQVYRWQKSVMGD